VPIIAYNYAYSFLLTYNKLKKEENKGKICSKERQAYLRFVNHIFTV